jgi:C4-dicarboxylate-specific signal transduction histidine kinase
MFVMALAVILGGMIIMRGVFDEFKVIALFSTDVGSSADKTLRLDSDTEEVCAISSAIRSLTERMRHSESLMDERIAEMNDLRASLHHAGRLAQLGQMTAALAHEMNQPLNVIGLTTQMCLMDEAEEIVPPLHPKVREKIVRLDNQVARIKELVDHLRTYARRGDGWCDRRVRVDVGKTLEDALLLTGNQLHSIGIRLEKEFEQGLPVVAADPLRLEQVFVNLISNAKDAMEGKKERILRIKAGRDGNGHVAIDFIDTGDGVRRELRERIFKPFFTTKEPGKGTGLGLSISRQIIKEHGGEISLLPDGGGAAFRVNLPAEIDS